MSKRKLMIVQPVLADYRVYFFNKLADHYNMKLFCDDANNSSGHKKNSEVSFPIEKTRLSYFFNNKVYVQSGLLKGLFSFKPDVIFITAHRKSISFWLLLFVSRLISTKTFVHGQGLYNKPKGSWVLYSSHKLMILLAHKYVCYTKSSLDSLTVLPMWCQNKCVIADNTIYNKFSLSPENKDYTKSGILYIGRMRDGCNLEMLITVIIELNKNLKDKLSLHIIGGGKDEAIFKKYEGYEGITFYGRVFDQDEITTISKKCFLGCYPGQAGLSIVHYMSLSLPPLVCRNMASHMGPEPSYIQDGINGFTFEEYSEYSIKESVLNILDFKNTPDYKLIGQSAYNTYKNLINPDFSDKLIDIIDVSFNPQ